MKKSEDFLAFVPNQTASIGEFRYSNTGILIGGLSLEYLYNEYRMENPHLKLKPLDFNGLIKEYIIKPAGMSVFTSEPPKEFKYNKRQFTAQYIAGSPAGGSFSTAEDLAKFGKWLYDECQRPISSDRPSLIELIKKYGQEFYNLDNRTIEHTGDAPSGSAFFSLNLETGNIIVVFNDQRGVAASELGRAIKENIFSKEVVVAKESQKLPGIVGQSIFTKKQGLDVTDKEMVKSAFGQGSDTAKELSVKKRR
jgi:hypothetical protein